MKKHQRRRANDKQRSRDNLCFRWSYKLRFVADYVFNWFFSGYNAAQARSYPPRANGEKKNTCAEDAYVSCISGREKTEPSDETIEQEHAGDIRIQM